MNKQILSFRIIIWGFLLAFTSFLGEASAYSVPDEVKNVKASQQAGKVLLEWDPGYSAEDVIIGYNIYYGVSSVKTIDDFYDSQVFVSAQTNHSFSDLELGVPYYFAVTAIDSQENESATYSPEISFTRETAASAGQEQEEVAEEVVEEEAPEEVIEEEVVTKEEEEVVEAPEEVVAEEPVLEQEVVQEEEITGGDVLAEDDFFGAGQEDVTPPLDATELQVDTSEVESGQTVFLTWSRSQDLDYDVQDQVLFIKKGHNGWDTGRSLGKDLEAIEIEVEPNQSYEVRLITIDLDENESVGVTTTFSTYLAESGPNTLLSVVIAFAFLILFLGFSLKRR